MFPSTYSMSPLANPPCCGPSRDAMIPTISPNVRVGTLTASLSLAGGAVQNGPGHADNMIPTSLDDPITRTMPSWMTSPLIVFPRSKRHQLTRIRIPSPGLDGPGLHHSNKTAASMLGNDGLVVRGGGGGVASPAPLGAVLFLTACFSAAVEQRTKAGSLVGAPLLSFGIFCVLRLDHLRLHFATALFMVPRW